MYRLLCLFLIVIRSSCIELNLCITRELASLSALPPALGPFANARYKSLARFRDLDTSFH